MADKNHPRRGSLAYKPQTRANRLYPSLSLPEDADITGVAGFAGYKTGMTRVLRIDDEADSPTKGQEVADAVTVVECPPLRVYGARAYEQTPEGEQPYTDVFADDIRDELARRQNVAGEGGNTDAIADALDDISDIRLLVHTQPQKAGIGKKTPESFELPVGGSVDEQWEAVQESLGNEIPVSEVLDAGQYVDVIGMTKGKGFQGPVKRHGVKKLPRKTQKSRRKAGNIGPWHPDHTSWKVPQPGRTGVNQRTELNKRILMLDDDTEQVNPGGGFKHYGEVQNEYLLVKGSVPGPAKRLIMFRPAVRNREYPENPEITHIEG